MRAIADYNGGPIVRTALLVSALTFQRPGNVRAMEWSEVNLDAGLWTIPAAKMKRVKAEKENGARTWCPCPPRRSRRCGRCTPSLGIVALCSRRALARPANQ